MKSTQPSKPNIIDVLGIMFLISMLYPNTNKPKKPSITPLILLALAIICCAVSHYMGYLSGCTTTGAQAKLYEAIIDSSKSGLPHTIEIAATTEESARKIAIEQGMPRGGFSLRPKVNNYLTVRYIQLCP